MGVDATILLQNLTILLHRLLYNDYIFASKLISMKNLTLLILCLLGFTPVCRASIYRTYQTGDGLSHNSVWAVMQDSRGYLWFGTNDGLNRFDGLNFKVYRRNETDTLCLDNNFIHCMLETRDGRILVGTKEGLYSFNPANDKFRHISLDGKSFGEDLNSVHCLKEASDGKIWVGCYGQGLYCLSPDFKVKSHYGEDRLPSRFVTAMELDATDDLWVGTDNAGFFRVDATDGKITTTALPKENVQTLLRHTDNTLWIGTSTSGLYHFDPRNHKTTEISFSGASAPVKDIKALTEYMPGQVIMGSEHGLLKLDCQQERLSPFELNPNYNNLPDNSIFAISIDHEGGIWLGTYYYGVSYLSPRINSFSFFPVRNITEQPSNYNIMRQFSASDDGNIILTSRNRGISLFSPGGSQVRDLPISNASGNIQAVMADAGSLWVGYYGDGISLLAYPSGSLKKKFTTAEGLPSNMVNSFYKDSSGKVYVGTTQGAAFLQDGRFFPLKALQGASVMTILEDYDGNIWFATHFHGLYRLSPEGKISNYKNTRDNPTAIPGNNINNIFLDSKGKIWVGTEGEGLAVFNPKFGKVEKKYSEASGLPSNIIYATQEDKEGNIWVTTGGGLVKVDRKTDKIQNFRYFENLLKIHYTHNSSLRANDTGNLYFGGSGGFITFNPENITINEDKPKVHISGYSIDGKPMYLSEADRAIVMEAKESTLSIDVACLSFLSPEQNTVAYRLVGYDEDWKYLDGRERHIEYMNLPWGDYQLEIKGANSDGVWSDPVAADVKVNRPLLLSNAMIGVYLILLIFLGYLIKMRVSYVQRRKMVKFSHAKEKELYEAKIGFFTNIAHEIRTPLSLISAPLEAILSSDDGNEKTRHNLAVMQSNVQRLLELINQLLDFRKVEAQLMKMNFRKSNVTEIINDICRRYEDFASIHQIKLDTKGVEPDLECNIDADAFEKIVGNLMSNAMKYADKKIKVSLKIDREKNTLRLEVTDDGPGIKEKDIDRIFESFYRVDDHGKHPGTGLGLPLARSIAEMHQGTLTVESQYGHGSTFILEIPSNLEEGQTAGEPDDGREEKPFGYLPEKGEDAAAAKATVLLVEDNEQLRTFIAESLSEIYVTKTAANGLEALKELEESMVDLVVSDIMMPDMDGIELLKVLRNNPEYSHLPVILLSAKTDVETKVEGLNTGADAYIEKPFSMEQVKAQIRSIFESRKRLQESFIKSPLDYYRKTTADDGKEAEKAAFIEKLNGMILDNLTNPDFSIDGIAQEFAMSRSSFHKRIKGITGETPNDYIRIVRLSKSAELLASGRYQIVEVCYMVGFNTPSYFSKCFAKHFGKLPKEYINDLNKNNNNN